MAINSKIREIYIEIQKQLFYMIPEKWDKLYLYSSIITHPSHLETGEMFFYYLPKGLLKRNFVKQGDRCSVFFTSNHIMVKSMRCDFRVTNVVTNNMD